MLMQAIRDRAQSWISWVIVILIIIVMAAFGLNAYFEPDPDVTVAKVDDSEIKFRRFQNAYENERSRMMQQLRGVDASILESLGLKDTVLNRLIDEEVLFQKVADKGFAIGDAQLAAYINQIQMFQKDGRFDQETYEQLLSSSRLTAAEWEQGQRNVLLMRQPENAVVNSAFVSNKSIEHLVKLQQEQRTFGYAVIPVSNYIKDIEISDEAAQSYFEENKDNYMHPQRVSVEYIELTVASLAEQVEIDEDIIQQRYEEQKNNFSVPERRRASHILVELDPEADDATTEEATKKINEVKAKLDQGEAFEDLAKDFSDDPGSAAQGGDLGFFERGIMDKAFEDAAFNLQEGELSSVVQSAFGLHLIKLTGIEASTVKPIEEIRDTLEQGYRDSVAENQFSDFAEQMDTLAFEHPDTLSLVSEQLGLEIKTSDYFSNNSGEGIARHAKVRKAAFEPDVFEDGNNSALIQISNIHVAVLRKKDFKESQHKTFDEVKQRVLGTMKREEAAKKAKVAAEDIVAQIKEGKSVTELLEPLEIAWNEPASHKRDDPAVNRDLLTAVFEQSVEEEGSSIFKEVEISGGDYGIYELTGVTEGQLSNLSDEELKSLKDRLAFSHGRMEYVSLISAWRDEAEIKTYPDRLE